MGPEYVFGVVPGDDGEGAWWEVDPADDPNWKMPEWAYQRHDPLPLAQLRMDRERYEAERAELARKEAIAEAWLRTEGEHSPDWWAGALHGYRMGLAHGRRRP